MGTAIVVFAKTLGLTPVKTRLGADIGQAGADDFYALSVKALKATLKTVTQQLDSVQVYWALAEEEGPKHDYWVGEQTLWTGGGDLGERLNRVTRTLFETHEAVIMIGTDSPHLTTECLVEAATALRKEPKCAVVGPCTDGGFYLFGSGKPLGEAVWTQVRYSQSDTLEQLLKRMAVAGLTWVSLNALEDVDHGADLLPLKQAFLDRAFLNSEQTKLLQWLKQYD